MSVLARIADLFDRSDDPTDGLELIRELLAEREAELALEAEYGRPHPNMTDEPTIAFPYTIYTKDGKKYSSGVKEFRLPDDGLSDSTAPLVRFIKERHGSDTIQTGDVDFEALANVEGTTAPAKLNEEGDLVVGRRSSGGELPTSDSTDSKGGGA